VRRKIWIATTLSLACSPPASRPAPASPPFPAPAPIPFPVAPPTTIRPAEGRIDIGAAGGLWYRIVGSAPDTVVIPLGAYLQEALAPLANAHTLVFYDPRHRGRSDAFADSTLSTFANDARDIEAVRLALGISRMSLVGFSYFSAVVATYAAAYPTRVSRVILLSPIEPADSLERAYDPAERDSRIDTVKARGLVKLRAAGRDTSDLVGYCQEYWRVNAPIFVGEVPRAARINPTWCQFPNESPRALGNHVGRTVASLRSDADLARVAARISSPTLVLHGERDLVANPLGARVWARLIPGARISMVAGAGHFVFLEERETIVRAIDRFLRGE
jgi:pimeloyl-ACP methyl ester carboxylesterase